jgi:hypothetical protein
VLEPAGKGQVRVRVFSLQSGRPDSLVGQRTFDARQTHSLKLYGLGGNDTFEVRGQPDFRFDISLYDGAGQDVVEWRMPAAKIKPAQFTFYDSGDGNVVRTPPSGLRIESYQPRAEEFDAAGWLLRHRLY